ncbi:MAG: tyrosine-type recombinase/integrase [Candidatus Eisenbacteria bacterium]|nr:tyrosine-type recombinase/integrase [Candidatus Eisenbacteria bacterium]
MPKLPRGLKRRSNGTFFMRDCRNGKDRWISFGKDRVEACRRYREFLKKRDGFPQRSDLLIEQLALRWLETYVPTARNQASGRLAASWVWKYLVPFFGAKRAERINDDDLRSYRLWLEKMPARGGKCLSPETVRHVLSDVRCMFNWAVDAGYLSVSPMPRRLLPRIPIRLPDALSEEETDALVAIADPHGFVVRLGLATALRWGDLVKVERKHVRNGMIEVEIGKTGDVRRIPLRPEIASEIRARIGPLVPFSAKSKGSFTRTVRRRSGVRRFHIHMLRHSAAMMMLREGWRLEAVQEILGHKSVTTTQRYARFSEQMVRSEAERLWGTGGSAGKTVANP